MADPPGLRLPAAFLGPPIAHRGLHDRRAGRIENSRAAVAAAAACGYAVEIDVRMSADGEAMVFHDAGLSRLTDETGPLCERSADDLGRTRLKGADETIPTLAEILAVIAGRVALLVEIKDQGERLDDTGVGPLEARVAALLSRYDGPVAAMSFNPASVAAFGAAAPSIPRGLVAGGPLCFEGVGLTRARRAALAALSAYDASGACFVSYDHRALPTPETTRLRESGAPVLCWTVRSAAQEAEARRSADNVTFEGYRAEIPG